MIEPQYKKYKFGQTRLIVEYSQKWEREYKELEALAKDLKAEYA